MTKTFREFINAPEKGFSLGLSVICDNSTHQAVFPDLNINFAVLKMEKGETRILGRGQELNSDIVVAAPKYNVNSSAKLTFNDQATALYLAEGSITISYDNEVCKLSRSSVFDFLEPLNKYEETLANSFKLALKQTLDSGLDKKDILENTLKNEELIRSNAKEEYLKFLNQSPRVVCFSTNQQLTITADSDVKLLVIQRPNSEKFGVKVITSALTAQFGDRKNNDERFVSEILSATRYPELNITLGDIWPSWEGIFTSYVPHKHPQPEIYYHESSDQGAPGLAQTADPEYWQQTKHEQTQVVHDYKGHSQAHFPYYVNEKGEKVRIHDWYLWVMPHMDRTKDVSLDNFR